MSEAETQAFVEQAIAKLVGSQIVGLSATTEGAIVLLTMKDKKLTEFGFAVDPESPGEVTLYEMEP